MKVKEIRKKKEKELEKLLSDKRKRLQEVRFKLASGKVKDVKEAKNIRQDISRILTILKEKTYEK